MKGHVLDASALYRFLTGRPGADIVGRLMKEARDEGASLRMSVVNWGEVYYAMARSRGFSETARVMERVKLLPLMILDADEPVVMRAAQLKAGYGLPYADCFAAATTGRGEVLVTSDAKDFQKVPELKLLALPEHKGKGRNK
ncbi:MAG TPA: type II toxin-antitoxin system VapC family toxin [Candidatus Sulfotelmatobacter sp.]